jgi:hypothetical protein
MTDTPGIHGLSSAPWAVLKPPIDKVRPHRKVPHEELRQTIGAIPWLHQNGAKRQSLAGELSPWWKAAQSFIHWTHPDVWERLLDCVQQRWRRPRHDLLNGTNMRAHTGHGRFGHVARSRVSTSASAQWIPCCSAALPPWRLRRWPSWPCCASSPGVADAAPEPGRSAFVLRPSTPRHLRP